VRYRWEPEAGQIDLTAQEAAARPAHYLTAALHARLEQGAVAFTLRVQLGEEGDPTHDPTVVWPKERKELTAGRLVLTGPADDPGAFNPTRLTPGIEPSNDPVLAFRGPTYPESVRRRTRHR
jgi:catalase